MEPTTKPKHTHTASGSGAGTSTERATNTPSQEAAERQAFYRDYREAVKEYRAGNPKRFLAYQKDPRITPPPESNTPLRHASAPPESIAIVHAERVALATEVKVAVISLMASVRSLTTTLSSLFS